MRANSSGLETLSSRPKALLSVSVTSPAYPEVLVGFPSMRVPPLLEPNFQRRLEGRTAPAKNNQDEEPDAAPPNKDLQERRAKDQQDAFNFN